MADVIVLKDKSVQTLFEAKDFQWLVEKYMGYDAENYFRKLIQELEESADIVTAKIDTDLESYEASLESNTRCFNDLLENIEEEMKLLDEKRLNKTQLGKLLDQMKKQIKNQI